MQDNELDIEKRWLTQALQDREQFGRFVEKYTDRIYLFCLRRTYDPDVAKDLTADTFVKALENYGRFQFRRVTFGAYLYRIALNQIRQRGRRRRRETGMDGTEADLADPRINPLAQLELNDVQRQVNAALAQLDAVSREIVQLHYWEEMTVAQIAVVLKMNESTVKSRLSRGRARMMELLTREDEGPDPDRGDRRPADRRTREDWT